MTDIAIAPRLTLADLDAMPDGDDYELVDGELLRRDMANDSQLIAFEIGVSVRTWMQGRGGVVLTEASLRLWGDNHGRRADLAYFGLGRIQGRVPRWSPIPPDLIVEVVSPGDRLVEIDTKVAEYIEAGVPLVWVVNPYSFYALVYRPGKVIRIEADETLDGGDILPGFRLELATLFAFLNPV